MTITLPDEMREELQLKATSAGFSTIDEYVKDVLSADSFPVPIPAPPPGARYAVTTRAELEAKLAEGMDRSGDVVAGPDFWDRRRAALDRQDEGGAK